MVFKNIKYLMFSTLVEISIDSSKFKSDFEKEIKEILHNIKKEETPKKKKCLCK